MFKVLFLQFFHFRSLVLASSVFRQVCKGCYENCHYMLFSNKIGILVDLLIHKLTVSKVCMCFSYLSTWYLNFHSILWLQKFQFKSWGEKNEIFLNSKLTSTTLRSEIKKGDEACLLFRTIFVAHVLAFYSPVFCFSKFRRMQINVYLCSKRHFAPYMAFSKFLHDQYLSSNQPCLSLIDNILNKWNWQSYQEKIRKGTR